MLFTEWPESCRLASPSPSTSSSSIWIRASLMPSPRTWPAVAKANASRAALFSEPHAPPLGEVKSSASSVSTALPAASPAVSGVVPPAPTFVPLTSRLRHWAHAGNIVLMVNVALGLTPPPSSQGGSGSGTGTGSHAESLRDCRYCGPALRGSDAPVGASNSHTGTAVVGHPAAAAVVG